jgi:hypothetical protein
MEVGLSLGAGETMTGWAVSSVLAADSCTPRGKALEAGMSSVGEMVGMAVWLTKLHPLAISNVRQTRIKYTRRDGIKST